MLKRFAPLVLLASVPVAAAQHVIDFGDLTLPPGSHYNGSSGGGGWSSGGAFFGNSYNSTWGSWSGFAYSNVQDATTAGFTNQYASFAGGGYGGSDIYALAYAGSRTFIDLPAGLTPASVRVTNTTYAALDMLHGSPFSKQFGGPTGNDPDFFELTFTGHNAVGGAGDVTGQVTFRLADYTFADNSLDYIVSEWTEVDLSPLGGARSIRLSFASSDVGEWGMNTPAYAALDHLTLVPEPAAAGLMFVAVGALLRRRRA